MCFYVHRLISQIGLVSAEEQRESLGLGKKPATATPGATGDSSQQKPETSEETKKDN